MRVVLVIALLCLAQPAAADEEVSEMQQIAGPPTAFLFGFGLGHAVEGRWHERGWKFTVADTAATAMFVVGSVNMECEQDCTAYGAAFATGLLALGVSRVWQTYDTVEGARAKNRRLRRKAGLSIAPAQGGTGAVGGVSMRF